jgi:nitroreductase
MRTTDISRDEALHAAVANAVLAPSVHNTQPWRFVLGADRLDFYADPSRQLAVLDRTGRQMFLSIGCALLNARVSLAAAGCRTTVVRATEPDDAAPVATLILDDDGDIDPALARLAAAVSLRQTNRRHFDEDGVPDALVQSLVDAARAEEAMLVPIVDADDRQTLARLSQRADDQQLTNASYRAELRAWTTNDQERRDGVRAAVVPHVDGTAHDELPIRDFDSSGGGWLPADTRSSAAQCLLVLGTETDSPQAWVHAGEALERVWLEITRAGFVASLFTQVIEEAGIRVQLRDELRLGMNPHVVVRVGTAPATASSVRRHISEVLDDRVRGQWIFRPPLDSRRDT